jgi:hypothetical protein
MTRRLSLLAGVIALAAIVQPAHAQERMVDRSGFYLGLNMLIGGVSAFTHSFLTPAHRDPGRAFLEGALGGAVTYGGQRLVGTGVPVLRLPGVQIAAVGSNMARNAGRGAELFSDLTLPFYPFYLRVRPGGDDVLSVRLSAFALATLGLAALDASRMQASLDWKESLLTGAPVFRSTSSYIYPFGGAPPMQCLHGDGCTGAAAGMHRNGISWYTTGGRTPEASRRILTHEVIHLTQVHRDAILHAIPMSDAALARVGGPIGGLARFLVFDAYLPLTGLNQLLATALPQSAGEPLRLYELEAHALTRGR